MNEELESSISLENESGHDLPKVLWGIGAAAATLTLTTAVAIGATGGGRDTVNCLTGNGNCVDVSSLTERITG